MIMPSFYATNDNAIVNRKGRVSCLENRHNNGGCTLSLNKPSHIVLLNIKYNQCVFMCPACKMTGILNFLKVLSLDPLGKTANSNNFTRLQISKGLE